MDLENFPTSSAAQRMIAAVFPIYDKSYVAKWLYQVMGLEMDEAWSYFEQLRNQGFPELATWGLQYWEQMYGIKPDAGKTLQFRRNNVIYKRTPKAPMNPAKLEYLLEQAIGVDFRVEENTADYTFTVWVSALPGKTKDTDITRLIKELKPAHLSCTLTYEQRTSASIYFGGVMTFGKIFEMKQVN